MSMFDALKSLGNPFELMKKAREMQERMQQVQEELSKRQVTADAGGGMVTATVNGKLELVKIQIDKSKIDPDKTEMLEDVITAAVSAAQTRAAGMMQEEMQKMATDAGLPPGLLPQR
jgi:DNA-binding YbaB/EbfC family protein